jgi:hypothetical protein
VTVVDCDADEEKPPEDLVGNALRRLGIRG